MNALVDKPTVLLPALPVLATSIVTLAGVPKPLLITVCAALPAKRTLTSVPAENVPEDLVKLPVTVRTCVVPELTVVYVPVPVMLKLFTDKESKLAALTSIFPVDGIDKVPPTVIVSAPFQPIFNCPVFTVRFPEILTRLVPLIDVSIT